MSQHKTDNDREPGRWTGFLEELRHPFMIGQGIAAPLFLDVSSPPRRWALVGEDELGAVRRVEIPRSWALELLACEAWCSEATQEATQKFAEQLLAEAETEQTS
jgi:hypothetical protein